MRWLFALLVVGTIYGGRAHAEMDPSIISLQRIDSVWVIVEDLSYETRALGVTRDWLSALTEGHLQDERIVAASRPDSVRHIHPYLYINLNVSVLQEIGLIYYNLSLDLHQPVILTRSLNMYQSQTGASSYLWTWAQDWPSPITAPTWGKAILGGAGTVRFARAVEESLYNLLDMFVSDHLAAHPAEGDRRQETGGRK